MRGNTALLGSAVAPQAGIDAFLGIIFTSCFATTVGQEASGKKLWGDYSGRKEEDICTKALYSHSFSTYQNSLTDLDWQRQEKSFLLWSGCTLQLRSLSKMLSGGNPRNT